MSAEERRHRAVEHLVGMDDGRYQRRAGKLPVDVKIDDLGVLGQQLHDIYDAGQPLVGLAELIRPDLVGPRIRAALREIDGEAERGEAAGFIRRQRLFF
ncbi:hypothetical protein SDC9_168820 [bioreactor metagenome]|uniref:Uncharacterized protein n=1 Tax=bioreactor metagenome TaxID=1076179 RepID=A0A645G3J6_9ZZZZ